MASSLLVVSESMLLGATSHQPENKTSGICLEKRIVQQNGDVDLENVQYDASSDGYTNIPRADGGRDAWLFLAACFLFEAFVWGFPFSFGVFQAFYSTHAPFSEHKDGIAAIGTCSTGVMYLFAPVSLYCLEAWPVIRRYSSIVGLIIATGALVASSFSSQVWHLILTQGVLYAIGGSLLYSPAMFYVDEWFVKKKGLAFGVMWAGVGASGLVFPFLLSALLDKWGFATTLRIWACILCILCTPLIYYIKPRLPVTESSTPPQKPSYAFFLTPTHLLLQASNILESLGFFIPAIYLPSYVTSLHLSSFKGTLLLALLNLFSVVGAIFLGHLCDKMHISHVIGISTIGSVLAVLVFWGTASEVTRLIIFTMIYGTFAGGYSAIWIGMVKEIQSVNGFEHVGMGVLMGVFAAGRGIGAVASGPISEVLMGRRIGLHAGYGSQYGVMILFTGLSALAGGVGWFVSRRMRDTVEGSSDDDTSNGDSRQRKWSAWTRRTASVWCR